MELSLKLGSHRTSKKRENLANPQCEHFQWDCIYQTLFCAACGSRFLHGVLRICKVFYVKRNQWKLLLFVVNVCITWHLVTCVTVRPGRALRDDPNALSGEEQREVGLEVDYSTDLS